MIHIYWLLLRVRRVLTLCSSIKVKALPAKNRRVVLFIFSKCQKIYKDTVDINALAMEKLQFQSENQLSRMSWRYLQHLEWRDLGTGQVQGEGGRGVANLGVSLKKEKKEGEHGCKLSNNAALIIKRQYIFPLLQKDIPWNAARLWAEWADYDRLGWGRVHFSAWLTLGQFLVALLDLHRCVHPPAEQRTTPGRE